MRDDDGLPRRDLPRQTTVPDRVGVPCKRGARWRPPPGRRTAVEYSNAGGRKGRTRTAIVERPPQMTGCDRLGASSALGRHAAVSASAGGTVFLGAGVPRGARPPASYSPRVVMRPRVAGSCWREWSRLALARRLDVFSEIREELVSDSLFVDGSSGLAHRLAQLGVPGGRQGISGERDVGGISLGPGPVVGGVHQPGLGAVTVDDVRRDGDAGPVEVAVIPELAACLCGQPGQPVERRGGAALRADDRRAGRAEFLAGAPKDGGILADEYPGKTEPDRVGGELVQRHLERGAVAGRAGQPLGQARSLRGDVEDKHPAGQVIDYDAGKVPQLSALRGGSWPADAGSQGQGAQHQCGQGRAVIKRLRVAGELSGERGQGDRRGGRWPGFEVLKNADGLSKHRSPKRGRVVLISQPRERAVPPLIVEPRAVPRARLVQ